MVEAECDGSNLDLAQHAIIQKIEEGDLPTCRAYFNRYGKHRFEGGSQERLSPAKLANKQLDAMAAAFPKRLSRKAVRLVQDLLIEGGVPAHEVFALAPSVFARLKMG